MIGVFSPSIVSFTFYLSTVLEAGCWSLFSSSSFSQFPFLRVRLSKYRFLQYGFHQVFTFRRIVTALHTGCGKGLIFSRSFSHGSIQFYYYSLSPRVLLYFSSFFPFLSLFLTLLFSFSHPYFIRRHGQESNRTKKWEYQRKVQKKIRQNGHQKEKANGGQKSFFITEARKESMTGEPARRVVIIRTIVQHIYNKFLERKKKKRNTQSRVLIIMVFVK